MICRSASACSSRRAHARRSRCISDRAKAMRMRVNDTVRRPVWLQICSNAIGNLEPCNCRNGNSLRWLEAVDLSQHRPARALVCARRDRLWSAPSWQMVRARLFRCGLRWPCRNRPHSAEGGWTTDAGRRSVFAGAHGTRERSIRHRADRLFAHLPGVGTGSRFG